MSKDPAFLFYAGDYLRDTQCLSEKSQVAYDRIMCEHMRNICISQDRLNFFTKRLSESEKEELISVLTPINGGFQIEWVALSIENRRAYSESRRSNRQGKHKVIDNNISKTYVEHMENEIENINEDVIKDKEYFPTLFNANLPLEHYEVWKEWLDYCYSRDDIKLNKTVISIWLKLLRSNPTQINEIIKTAMQGNWKGLHEVKNGFNGANNKFKNDKIDNSTYQPAESLKYKPKCDNCDAEKTPQGQPLMRMDKFLVCSRKCYEELKNGQASVAQSLADALKIKQ